MKKGVLTKSKSVEEYISKFSLKHQLLLKEMRKIIRSGAPKAEEVISYNMPAFKLNGMLVYYAANKEHIGFYPGNGSTVKFFKEDLSAYETSAGAIRFPIDKKLPVVLIKKIVKYRAKENLAKSKKK